ncbi:MAG TPA: RES domain-containing protein [Acetobacteraceae bacterium]|nr:RES domain-containing protein [Acetobacteraceae bacterium]
MRFFGTCYRAHDPRWSFKPISGAGAAIHGGRFNPRGVEALCLGLSIIAAVNEANQGQAFKIQPCVLCCYNVDCDDIADLRDEAGRATHRIRLADMACAWFSFLSDGKEPPSWDTARKLIAAKQAGIVVPSFAPGATDADHNLVLWKWSDQRPHRVRVFDPTGRLPKDQLSWC